MAGQGRRTFIWAFAAVAASIAFVPSLVRLPSFTAVWLPLLQGLACIAFIAGMVYLIFAATPSPSEDVVAPLPEPRRDIIPTALIDVASDREIDTHVQDQVSASLRYSRTVGVIYFDLNCHHRICTTSGLETADRACLEIAALLRSRVRAYDFVMRLEKDQFVVCLSQLREKSELMAISERLVEFLQQVRVVGLPDHLVPATGQAIYPLCGYSGRELVDFAKASAVHQRAVLTGSSERIPSHRTSAKDDRPAALKPARKPRRRAALSVVDSEASDA